MPRRIPRIEAAALTAFYLLKPLIPRGLQIAVRRAMIHRKRARFGHVWPIDEEAGKPPARWRGWPGGKRFAFVLTHDVDTAGGQRKCRDLMSLEQKHGFVSSFNFVPNRYETSPEIRFLLADNGFEVGVHGLHHDGNYYRSREKFRERAVQINRYLREWNAVGFRTPCMFHNLEWIRDLDILYDASTFDTDPFEPQPDGMRTIFPFRVGGSDRRGYVELPYTLPQDFTLFILMKETDIGIWKRKLAWIAEKGGMALLNTHPDYMALDGAKRGREEYPAEFYGEFLDHVRNAYSGEFWHVLPREMASFVHHHEPFRFRKLA
jgi:peptidoglycan/xylan/chitin deacetylase (PgdA/CDA1 family)